MTIKQAQLRVAAGAPTQTLTYDLNGNLTGDGARTFTWDAENRLTSVTTGGQTYAWTYNGASQRVSEKVNGTLSKQWVWDDKTPKVELNASNAVTKRFYKEGMVTGATLPPAAANKAFYTRDHLGSIREVTDGSGTLLARYDYDPYGRRTKLSGTFDADFGYTGHYFHPASGLHLAFYRAYDADLARWLSRDPVEDAEFLPEGPNLYAYVGNYSTIRVDPDGRWWAAAAVVAGVAYLAYKIYKACNSLGDGMDKATKERQRRSDAIENGDWEHSGIDPKAFNDISKDISKGCTMPGTSVTGPARNPGPSFPDPGGVPLPVR